MEKCDHCGEVDDLTTCADCRARCCSGCIEWCSDEYDQPSGDYFCLDECWE